MPRAGAAAANDELLLAGNQLGLNAAQSGDIRTGLNNAPQLGTVTTPQDEASLKSSALNQYLQTAALPGNINPDFQNTLKAIQTNVAGAPQLQTLDAASKGNLDAITAASQAKFDLQQGDLKRDLLNNLFGAGTERSTIALDQGGRLAYGLGANQAQLLSDAANRELTLRNQLSDRFLQNAQLQAGITGQGADIALQEAGLQQQGQNARAGLLSNLFGQQLTRDVTNEELKAAERNRLQQDVQFREGNLLDLAQGRAGIQSTRKSGLQQALSGALALGSFALPGGGSLGGTLLKKIPGLG